MDTINATNEEPWIDARNVTIPKTAHPLSALVQHAIMANEQSDKTTTLSFHLKFHNVAEPVNVLPGMTREQLETMAAALIEKNPLLNDNKHRQAALLGQLMLDKSFPKGTSPQIVL